MEWKRDENVVTKAITPENIGIKYVARSKQTFKITLIIAKTKKCIINLNSNPVRTLSQMVQIEIQEVSISNLQYEYQIPF